MPGFDKALPTRTAQEFLKRWAGDSRLGASRAVNKLFYVSVRAC
jgi:hypothetical protein